MITLEGGARVEVNYNHPFKCRMCDKAGFWAKTEMGKWMPIVKLLDGKFASHFADCPHANNFRKEE